MSLLRDIQEASTLSEGRVADLLRKCKILAARLDSEEFGRWVDCELNGYQKGEQLPEYRVMKIVESCGNFSGPFGSGLKNAPIPSVTIPEEYRDLIETEHFMAGISVYEDLLRDGTQGSFRASWPSNLVAFVGQRIYQNMNCLQAWKTMPRGAIVGIIDAVKNKILSFALDIEKENPQAGDAPFGSTPIPEQVVRQIFNNNFYGNVGNVATGSENFEQNIKGD